MIRVERLTKSYGSGAERGEPVVDQVSFQNDTGRFLTLLGPSGCGKTTTLRCIAGLETPDAGEIQVGARVVYSSAGRIDVSPARRRIGMVFQSYAIWPHMNVLENVVYPLRFQRQTSRERRRRALEVLEIVGLAHLADRPAPFLSGGQQQRVALARALVGRPEVLLLDEPLSNLDAALRRNLGGYLRELQLQLGLTVIYVTHDQSEAISMSDSIALMERGRIVEQGDPVSMYCRPRSRFTASFLEDANYLAVTAIKYDEGALLAQTSEGWLAVDHPSGARPDMGEDWLVMIRPEDMVIQTPSAEGGPSQAVNTFRVTVESRRYFGFLWEYQVRTEEGLALMVKSLGKQELPIGSPVLITAGREACVLVADAPEPEASMDE
jgi:iron(III) transport system ATP-binding protein